MRKPRSGLVIIVAVPFLAACVRVHVQPLPAPDARQALDVRGVVLRSDEAARIEFGRVDRVTWTDSTVELTGVLRAPAGDDAATGVVTTRSFLLSALSGVLVREIDADRTSIIIAAVGIGTAVIAALVFTGKTDEGTARTLRDY